jgi:hypothetical protein
MPLSPSLSRGVPQNPQTAEEERDRDDEDDCVNDHDTTFVGLFGYILLAALFAFHFEK